VPEDARICALHDAYRRFNDRDFEGALQFLDADVEWPDLINDRMIRGRDAVLEYWRASLALVAPIVSLTEYFIREDDVVVVVSQQVTGRYGGQEVEQPMTVAHRYTFHDGLIAKLVVLNSVDEAGGDPVE
jgi:hypothetical protein